LHHHLAGKRSLLTFCSNGFLSRRAPTDGH